MKYCPKCGKQLVDEAVICVSCGCAQGKSGFAKQTDGSSFGWGLIGFLIPLLGLILYILWKDTMPKKAKSVGIGAIVGAVAGFLLSILFGVIYGFWVAAFANAFFAY